MRPHLSMTTNSERRSPRARTTIGLADPLAGGGGGGGLMGVGSRGTDASSRPALTPACKGGRVNFGHRQHDDRVGFDWGLDGASAIVEGRDVAVVVDVPSFTTTLSVAADRGVVVLPYRWRDDGAGEYARRHDAVLAVSRAAEAMTGQVSLSPASVRAHPHPPARLVLPSPNGSSIAHQLGDSGVVVVAACLRNASAVAAWLDRRPGGERIAVIAAGERWPKGGLRPAVEDGWGAGGSNR